MLPPDGSLSVRPRFIQGVDRFRFVRSVLAPACLGKIVAHYVMSGKGYPAINRWWYGEGHLPSGLRLRRQSVPTAARYTRQLAA